MALNSAPYPILSPLVDPVSPNLIPVSPSGAITVPSPGSTISLLNLYEDKRSSRRNSTKGPEPPISPTLGKIFIPGRYPTTRPIPIRTRIHGSDSTPGSPHLSPVSVQCTPTSLTLDKFALDRT